MTTLRALDSRGSDTAHAPAPASVTSASLRELAQLEADMTSALRDWVFADPRRRNGAGDFYEKQFATGKILHRYEAALLHYLTSRFVPAQTRVVEVGVGYGLLSLLLAAAGFDVVAFEGDVSRFDGMTYLKTQFGDTVPNLRDRFRTIGGWFPDAFEPGMFAKDRRNVFLSTNIVHVTSDENQERILQTARLFDDALIDVTRFGIHRYRPGEADTFKEALAKNFRPIRVADREGANEIWHFKPRLGEELNAAQPLTAGDRPAKVPPARATLRPPFVADGGHAWYTAIPPEFGDITDTEFCPGALSTAVAREWHSTGSRARMAQTNPGKRRRTVFILEIGPMVLDDRRQRS